MKLAKQSDNSGVIEDVDQRSAAWPLGPQVAPPVHRHQTNHRPGRAVFPDPHKNLRPSRLAATASL